MVRKFKHHEQKLLKKVNFFEWKKTDNLREPLVMRRYHIEGREDYVVYNRLAGMIQKLAGELATLPVGDPVRAEVTVAILDRLYDAGVINGKNTLSQLQRVTAASIARRRLPVLMHAKLKMAESVKQACTYIEQGHVRVGPECITNPAFMVSRLAEDFITWTEGSRIREKIANYKGNRDDYDLMRL